MHRLSAIRNLWPRFPAASCGDIDPFQRRRRVCAQIHEGIHLLPSCRSWIDGGTGNAAPAGAKRGLPAGKRCSRSTGSNRGNRAHPACGGRRPAPSLGLALQLTSGRTSTAGRSGKERSANVPFPVLPVLPGLPALPVLPRLPSLPSLPSPPRSSSPRGCIRRPRRRLHR